MNKKIETKEKESTFVKLTSDSGFKAAFRDRNNQDALITLLNTYLPADRQVVSLQYADREMDGDSIESKTNVLDLRCIDQFGREFICEMQKKDFENFSTRCFVYAASVYSSNVERGDLYFKTAKPVYLIALLASDSKDPMINRTSKLISRCGFQDDDGYDFENKFINVIFVRLYELDKHKEPDENTPSAERCSWLLSHLDKYEEMPPEKVVGEFGNIVEAAHLAGYSKEKKRQYKDDMYNEMLREAIEHEQLTKSREEGKAEGLAEGKLQAKLETAKKLLDKGMSVSEISEITGLSEEEIKSL